MLPCKQPRENEHLVLLYRTNSPQTQKLFLQFIAGHEIAWMVKLSFLGQKDQEEKIIKGKGKDLLRSS